MQLVLVVAASVLARFGDQEGTKVHLVANASYKFADNPVDRKLHFIHISKTSGTAVEAMGRAHGIKWGRFEPGCSRCDNVTEADSCWHEAPSERCTRKHPYFTVIRNPFARVLSEFNFMKIRGELNEWITGTLPKCPVFNCNVTIQPVNNTGPTNTTQISDHIWTRARSEHPERLVSLGILGTLYLEPQSWYLKRLPWMRIHVISLENRTKELQLLFRRYAININRTEIMRLYMPGGCDGHACEAWETKPPAKVADLSAAAVETIRMVYAADFAAFGYSMDPGKYRLPPSGGAGYTQGGHMLKAGYAQLIPQQRCNTHNFVIPVVIPDEFNRTDEEDPNHVGGGECYGYVGGDDDDDWFSVDDD
jgi:hypothetical protein